MASQIILLDGSIGHLLKSKGLDSFSDNLAFHELFAAGSLANMIKPDIVRKVHEAYALQNCNVITTNTFGCTKFNLQKIPGTSDHQAIHLAIAAAQIAREVADAYDRNILVAGCLPPLQESYQVYAPHNTTATQLNEFEEEYIQLATAIATHVDIFIFETLSSITEALVASRAACNVQKLYPSKPWWISFTLEDSERAVLRSGEPLDRAAREVCHNFPENSLEAILINCCAPAAVTAGLKVLKPIAKEKGFKMGGYANGFKTTTSEWLHTTGFEREVASAGTDHTPAAADLPDSSPPSSSLNQQLDRDASSLRSLPTEEYDAEGIILPEAYLKYARQWTSEECGATIVGGCCGIGPEHIAQLEAHLR
ncbi:hypothetical protein Ndes2526A_g04880 [Nannochloris sp. 'desiccata']